MDTHLATTAAEAESAIRKGARDPELYCIMAWHAGQQGDLAAAQNLFQSALKLAPRHADALFGMGALCRQHGQLRDALLYCDAAIEANPGFADAWLEKAFTFAAGGSMESAKNCYLRTVALDESCAAAFAGLASIAARDGDSEEGRNQAQRALALDPGNVIATCALATMDIESKHHEAARAILEPLIDGMDQPSTDRATALGLLGDALNRLDLVDPAYAAYAASQSDFDSIYGARFLGRETQRTMMDRITAQIPAIRSSAWDSDCAAVPIANAASNHIFLLGYPRSGTTLVENVLASIHDVFALEERPTMAAADRAFLAEADGLLRFGELDADALRPFREAYWQKVEDAGIAVAGKSFVDMDPLKGIRLPLIARLFPDARILIMRRDPRDIVWSCFHTNFALSSAALEFTTLEQTARHYDALMRLTQAALDHLPLKTHEVRYDALVSDFDSTSKAFCDFAQLEWSPALRNFDRTAKQRGVSTASAGQVRKGLYDGTRQWERYRRYLEPVIPILQPWIVRFGFD